jgi:flagellar protein FlgJ
MSDFALSSVLPGSAAALPAAHSKSQDPAKVRDAAQQFEALLVGQILRSAREGGSNWLSDGDDQSAEVATDYAEQQFATVMAQKGGLGLADMIAKGLEQKSATHKHE